MAAMTLPAGTVTCVFTDIEGSTALVKRLGDRYGDVLRTHRRIVRDTFGPSGGVEIDTQGDSFFFAFPRAREAVAAAVEVQRAHATADWPEGAPVRVRIGLHTGEPTVGDEGYLGLDVVRAARISAAGHGGQILLSETTRALVGNDLPTGVSVHDLGEQNLKDIQHERVYELALDGRPAGIRPLKTQAKDNRVDAMAKRFEERVTSYVEQQLEAAFTGGKPPEKMPVFRLAAGGLSVAAFGLLLLIAIVVVVILLAKWLF
jgi:class 3 adenylate cyclase